MQWGYGSFAARREAKRFTHSSFFVLSPRTFKCPDGHAMPCSRGRQSPAKPAFLEAATPIGFLQLSFDIEHGIFHKHCSLFNLFERIVFFQT
jgi:hypothetical protein